MQAKRWCAAFGAMLGVACGGGGDSGTTPPPLCAVQSVSVAPATASVPAGRTVDLTAGVTQTNCATVAVTWTSSVPNVASVSATGQVTGLALGSSTISASAGGRSGSAAITVVAGPVLTVTIAPAAPSVEVRGAITLTATARDTLGNVVTATPTWTSADATVATVSNGGVVTGVKVGTTTVTATAALKSGTATVTVTPPSVASIVLTPGTRSVDAGTTLIIHAQPLDGSGAPVARTVSWSVSNAAVANVVTSANNVASVEFATTGVVTVTASADGRNGALPLTIVARRPRFAYAYVFDTTAVLPPFAYDTTDLAYNSAGGQVVVQRKGPGEWRVIFPGLRLNFGTEPVQPLVRAMGTAAGGCVSGARYTGPFNASYGDVYAVDVECAASDGTPQTRPFLLTVFGTNYTTIPWAFTDITDATSAVAGNTYIPGSGTATTTRASNDVYHLQLSPLPAGNDVWHAVSLNPGLACAVVSLTGTGATRGADVDCVTSLGARTRSRTGLFAVLNGRDQVPRADGRVSAAGVVTATGGAVAPVAIKTGTGSYRMRVAPPGLTTTRYPAFIVSAERSPSSPTVACRVVTLSQPVTGTAQALVECRDTQGTLRDTPFSFTALY